MLNTEKIYYSMNEAQEMTGLPASTLRYWEKHFDQLNPRKDGHGNRYYTMVDIALIKQIKYLRDEMHITRIVKSIFDNAQQTFYSVYEQNW